MTEVKITGIGTILLVLALLFDLAINVVKLVFFIVGKIT
jgi:hypothetical protein